MTYTFRVVHQNKEIIIILTNLLTRELHTAEFINTINLSIITMTIILLCIWFQAKECMYVGPVN